MAFYFFEVRLFEVMTEVRSWEKRKKAIIIGALEASLYTLEMPKDRVEIPLEKNIMVQASGMY